ncbi:MAG: hypothetical protein ACOY58_04890 [Candidatus Micrarchaeota archaeon]
MKTLRGYGRHPREGQMVRLVGKTGTRCGNQVGRLVRIRHCGHGFVGYWVELASGREVCAPNYDLEAVI